MSVKSKIVRIVLPLLILAAGIVAAKTLIANRPEPQRTVRENPGALVETLTVERGERQVRVYGTGTVQARNQVEIIPQVGGRVTEVSPNLVAGGFFAEGELLFRIEEADYRLALDRARAALAKAEFDLATVEGQARVARQEWGRLDLSGGAEAPNPLVLFEPQLKNAEAALLSARASLRQAELDLERTAVRAPFDAVVLSRNVDLGQIVRTGATAAVLAGSQQAEIVVPLPLHELGWLQIPRGAGGTGSEATVQLATGGRTFFWTGRIVRSLGEVDQLGRMARVVVAVEDPYGLKRAEDRPELAVGTFVQVILHGRTLPDAAVLPAGALRDDGTVWVMNDERLVVRSVEVVRRTRDEVVIGEGITSGDKVVLTPVAGAAEGMRLRSRTEAAATEQ